MMHKHYIKVFKHVQFDVNDTEMYFGLYHPFSGNKYIYLDN